VVTKKHGSRYTGSGNHLRTGGILLTPSSCCFVMPPTMLLLHWPDAAPYPLVAQPVFDPITKGPLPATLDRSLQPDQLLLFLTRPTISKSPTMTSAADPDELSVRYTSLKKLDSAIEATDGDMLIVTCKIYRPHLLFCFMC